MRRPARCCRCGEVKPHPVSRCICCQGITFFYDHPKPSCLKCSLDRFRRPWQAVASTRRTEQSSDPRRILASRFWYFLQTHQRCRVRRAERKEVRQVLVIRGAVFGRRLKEAVSSEYYKKDRPLELLCDFLSGP